MFTIEILPSLQDVCLTAYPGELQALLGPSGSGKTTLLNFIGGKTIQAETRGFLLVDGVVCSREWRAANIAMVEQYDYLLSTSTVRETLTFSAALGIAEWDEEVINARVDHAIKALNLEKRADSFVGGSEFIRGLSGGERRRVSIGEQLVKDPEILLLDEPFSGLDSENCKTLMKLLRKLARNPSLKERMRNAKIENSETRGLARGRSASALRRKDIKRTIIFSIHQPSSQMVQAFDRICLMASGKIVFNGKRNEVKEFFRVNHKACPVDFNPADFYIQEISVKTVADRLNRAYFPIFRLKEKKLEELKKNNMFPKQLTCNANQIYYIKAEPVADWKMQFYYITMRKAWQWIRDPFMLAAEGVQYFGSSIFIGLIFFDVSDDLPVAVLDRTSATGLLLTVLAFIPSFTTMINYHSDRLMIKREMNASVYSLSAYFMSTTLVSLITELVMTFMFSIIAYNALGFRLDNSGAFPKFLSAIWMWTLTSETIGLLIAVCSPSSHVAILVHTPVACTFFFLGGFLTATKQDAVSWFDNINPLYYAAVAIIQNEFIGQNFFELQASTGSFKVRVPVPGESVIREPLQNGLSYAENIACLLTILLGIRVTTYFLWRYTINDKRSQRASIEEQKRMQTEYSERVGEMQDYGDKLMQQVSKAKVPVRPDHTIDLKTMETIKTVRQDVVRTLTVKRKRKKQYGDLENHFEKGFEEIKEDILNATPKGSAVMKRGQLGVSESKRESSNSPQPNKLKNADVILTV